MNLRTITYEAAHLGSSLSFGTYLVLGQIIDAELKGKLLVIFPTPHISELEKFGGKVKTKKFGRPWSRQIVFIIRPFAFFSFTGIF